MDEKIKHTPTPWRMSETLDSGWGIRVDNGFICFMARSNYNHADTKFIITAVNNFEALLEIVKNGNRHDAECRYHLDKTYPCAHCIAIFNAEKDL